MKLIKIGNYKLPCPSTYVATTSTIVDSGRNVNGKVIGAVVREDVAAIDATYKYISVEEWATILQLFSAKHGGSFYRKVTFYDQVSNSIVTRTMYIGDRTSSGLHILDKNGNPQGWCDAKLSLVEK